MFDLEMSLSPHFKLKELVFTTHRNIDNTPTPEVLVQLVHLCASFLEPLRAKFGPLNIHSGYRSPALNAAVGGVATSAHSFGCAADFLPADSSITTHQIVLWLRDESGLPFDQVIDEWGSATSNWVHCGQLRPGHEAAPRKQALLFKGGVYSVFK